MMTNARIDMQLHRFEVVAVLVGGLIGTAAALVIAARLAGVGIPLECFKAAGEPSARCLDLLTAFGQIDRREAERFFMVVVVFPILAGLLLGIPAISRELERGTAALPWTLHGSRGRWLLRRSIVLGAVLFVALLPLAFAAEHLEGVRHPTVPAAESFVSDGLRGWPLLARGFAGFGAGILIGLLVGRQLPALIVGLLVAFLIVVGSLMVMHEWARAAGVPRPLDAVGDGDYRFDSRLRARDGTILTFREAEALQPERIDALPPGTIDETWILENFDEVAILVPGARYPEAIGLHAGLLVIVGLAGVALSLSLIGRRRPT
jgi:hypothetical protein